MNGKNPIAKYVMERVLSMEKHAKTVKELAKKNHSTWPSSNLPPDQGETEINRSAHKVGRFSFVHQIDSNMMLLLLVELASSIAILIRLALAVRRA